MVKIDHHRASDYPPEVLRALNYINHNLVGDVSLETLAGIANYSPSHFQKIFSQSLRESPKQYVMRLRLERAAHYLKNYDDLPIIEVAMGCGFSSPSVFSRAFKNYYGITAEEFRAMPLDDLSVILEKNTKRNLEKNLYSQKDSDLWISQIIDPAEILINTIITPPPAIKFFNSLRIACIHTTLSHPENIYFAFKSLMQWAIPHDIVTPDVRYIGIGLDVPFYTSPDKCRYIAAIEVQKDIKPFKGISMFKISEGKYANFQMTGNLESTVNHLITLNHNYLAEMGYEMSEIIWYEVFSECPAYKSYADINKNIWVPVKAHR
jgi:AraC family transcriptional regulator